MWQPSRQRYTAGAANAYIPVVTRDHKLLTGSHNIFLLYEISIHPFTWVKQYPVEKVWLPKLHYRGSLNWQGNSVHSHWSSQPTDKGELIKNKNLIKPVLNQQQLQGIRAACKDRFSFHTFHKAVTWDSLKNSWTEKKSVADIDQREGYTFYTYSTASVAPSRQNIDEIYPISDCDTLYFEVCIFAFFLEGAAIASLWWSPGSPRLSSLDA